MHPVRLYSPKSLNSELKEENMMVVQITDATTYFKGHIPNAILVSPEEIMGTPGMGVGKLPSLDLINILLSKIGYRFSLFQFETYLHYKKAIQMLKLL